METQLTVRVPEELKEALETTAAKMNSKPSELVRLALRDFLAGAGASGVAPADRVRELLGSLESGVPDLAERHREYILESLRDGS